MQVHGKIRRQSGKLALLTRSVGPRASSGHGTGFGPPVEV